MTKTAYDRAVEMFEALLSAPSKAAHASPTRLIQHAEVPPSSGYRHVATLEAEGLLTRDALGVYLQGPAALRTGLSGFGLGHVMPITQPILMQARQRTRHTAFVAVVRDLTLWMGPHSIGRDSRGASLMPRYRLDARLRPEPGQAVEAGLTAADADFARRTSTLVALGEHTAQGVIVLGLVLSPSRGASDVLRSALIQAQETFMQAQSLATERIK